jgi:hypothetical protein
MESVTALSLSLSRRLALVNLRLIELILCCRTPSHTLTANLRQEAAKFQMNIEHATKSDSFVRRKYDEHRPILGKLAGGPVCARQ